MIKRMGLRALAVALSLLLIPAAVRGIEAQKAKKQADAEKTTQVTAAASDAGADEVIAVFLPEANETKTLSMRDYVIGCVAAEMPAVYEDAALRAQAAASAALARYMQANNKENDALKGGVIAADPASYQGYYTEEEMRERWGDDFDRYYQKIAAAVDETLPYTLTYNGAPVVAAFHAVSSGETETAETAWGKAIPYLISVESAGDKLCPGYASTETASPEAFKEALGLTPDDDDPATWLGAADYSDAGTLRALEVCDKTVSGQTLRKAFALRSPAVRVEYDGEEFILKVTGYGHGVGMSQYGADYYARQGLTWQEIIAHYYPGTTLTKAEK